MMIPMYVDENVIQGEIAKGVKKIEKKFKPDVVYIRHNIGENWMGDPAVYFRVLLSNAVAERFVSAAIKHEEGAGDRLEAVRNAVKTQIDPLGKWGLYPFVNFRSVSEQAYLKDEDWS